MPERLDARLAWDQTGAGPSGLIIQDLYHYRLPRCSSQADWLLTGLTRGDSLGIWDLSAAEVLLVGQDHRASPSAVQC